MLNPSIGKLLKGYKSRYQLVIDVSRRARHIALNYEERKEILTEKPVNLAIEELRGTVENKAPGEVSRFELVG